MPLYIVRDDITTMKVDAIVNSARRSLLGGGGVDGLIHSIVGPALREECSRLGGCPRGYAKITGGYNLPCKYIIHTVGPRWEGGQLGERDTLMLCYKTSLELALKNHCQTVAFPIISSGIYGYPKDQALQVATETISAFLQNHEMTVYLVVFDDETFQISAKLHNDIEKFIDDVYVHDKDYAAEERLRRLKALQAEGDISEADSLEDGCMALKAVDMMVRDEGPESAAVQSPRLGRLSKLQSSSSFKAPPMELPLEEQLKHIVDESFTEMVLRKIDQAKLTNPEMTDANCYKKANITRQLFSKIRCDRLYKPSKPTAVALAMALELPMEEIQEMLMKAGFALSRTNKFDIIIEYFIRHGEYNVFTINEVLFDFDQPLLGNVPRDAAVKK